MSPARFLLDTSALVRRLRHQAVRSRWEQQITAGLVAVCPLVELELLYTARSAAHRVELQDPRSGWRRLDQLTDSIIENTGPAAACADVATVLHQRGMIGRVIRGRCANPLAR